MMILVITGMPGAGKEEFLSVAMEKGISFARMGDVVREHHVSSGSADEGVSIGAFATNERDRLGKNIWAKRTMERMSGDIFLVDGCRSMAEIGAFKELGGDVKIVAIHSPPDIRHERLVKRGRNDAPADIFEFNERDAREISWGLGEVIALSDVMITNSSSLEDFRRSSAKVLGSMMQ